MNPTANLHRSAPRRRTALKAAGIIVLALLVIAAGKGGPMADITIYGRPALIVSSAVVSPRPGEEAAYPRVFDLTLTVSNTGSVTASHVVGTVPANEYVGTETGSALFGYSYIYPGKSEVTTLHMLLDHADPGGRVQPVIHFEYYSYDEEEDISLKYTGDEPVRLSFGEPGWNQPTLLLEELTTVPETPAPGDACILTVKLANISSGAAEQVLVRLGGADGPKPFATIGAGNVGHIPRIPAHKTAAVDFSLVVEGDTAAGLYPVPVSLTFRNVLGEELTDTQTVYLKVQNKPALQAGWIGELPAPLRTGEPFEITVEVINIGRQSVNVGTIELTSGELTLTNASIYAGPLDESTSTSIIANAVAEKAGPAEVVLTVHYLDEFNQPQTWTHTFQLTVEESAIAAESPADTGENPNFFESIWKAFLAFLGFGG
ncbi:MAG: hypothetical protein JW748_02940 [Anaerolineales bacterium]|nr:hypothetical protein [Anaerolineales bacterium]